MISLEQFWAALSETYVLDGELGHGGMATVFLAYDRKHSRKVAIKVFAQGSSAAGSAGRFLREIQTVARLNHPNILPLHDSGSVEDILYYVMPPVTGGSLRDRLCREGRLSFAESLHIASQVCDALNYAHVRGIVHRDIKPENILFADSGHCYVADFGLARALMRDTDPYVTATGVIVGSPSYMSPEQVTGSDQVDGRTDIYSLGCMLHEMITGSPPFQANSAHEIFACHVLQAPPPMEVDGPRVPARIDEAVKKAMRKDPDERFESAGAFRSALTAAGSGAYSSLYPRWLPRVASPFLRRVIAVVFLVVSAAGTIWGTVPWDSVRGLFRAPFPSITGTISAFAARGDTLTAVIDFLNESDGNLITVQDAYFWVSVDSRFVGPWTAVDSSRAVFSSRVIRPFVLASRDHGTVHARLPLTEAAREKLAARFGTDEWHIGYRFFVVSKDGREYSPSGIIGTVDRNLTVVRAADEKPARVF